MTQSSDIQEEIRYFENLKEVCLHLIRSKGWELYALGISQDAESEMKLAASESDPYKSARHLGAWHALAQHAKWPEEQIKACEVNIESRKQSLARKVP